MNNLSDLNELLFKQLNRLDACGNEEGLEIELKRSKETANLAKEIVSNGRLALDASVKSSSIIDANKTPKMLS